MKLPQGFLVIACRGVDFPAVDWVVQGRRFAWYHRGVCTALRIRRLTAQTQWTPTSIEPDTKLRPSQRSSEELTQIPATGWANS